MRQASWDMQNDSALSVKRNGMSLQASGQSCPVLRDGLAIKKVSDHVIYSCNDHFFI